MPQTPHESYEGGVMRRTAKNWKAIRDDEKRRGVGKRDGQYERALSPSSMIPEAAARAGYPDDQRPMGGRFKSRTTKSRSGRRR